MNKEELLIVENNRKYIKQGCASHQRCPINAISLNSRNKINHELSKSIGGIMLLKYGDIKFTSKIILGIRALSRIIELEMQDFPKVKEDFISECVPLDNPKRRIDLLRLRDELPYEFENKKIKKKGVISIYIGKWKKLNLMYGLRMIFL